MKKKILSLVLATTISISTLLPTTAFAANRDLNVSRIAGKGRIETAVEASKVTFKEGSNYAVVASGEKFADALVGGTLATQINAPILLVSKNSLPNAVAAEIRRLNVDRTFLLGGTGTIATSVENSIKGLGVEVERLAGKDRYETAKAIFEARFKLANGTSAQTKTAAINGNEFADALSAAPFIGGFNAPYQGRKVIISLMPFKSPMTPDFVFGGTNSVPLSGEEHRYAGSDRYETAVKVADAYKTHLNKDIDTIVLVDGTEFPDALSSAPVASMNNGAILLTHPTNFSKATKDYINNNDNIKNVIIVGGENSVSKNIEKELKGEVVEPTTPIENNFDKLDIGLQAYVATSITGDWREDELRELPWGMIFTYYYEGNTLYTQIHGGAGSGHPVYKFEIGTDKITYIDGVYRSGMDGYFAVETPSKSATKDDLYKKYISHKAEYDKATTNEYFISSQSIMKEYKENINNLNK